MTERPAVFALTRGGAALAETIAGSLPVDLHLPAELADSLSGGNGLRTFSRVAPALRDEFAAGTPLVCIMSAGVVVRSLSGHLGSKQTDPPVLVLDEAGRFVVPLLGGHLAGANELALRLAALLRAQAVLTTASDVQGRLGPDLLAERLGAAVLPRERLTRVAAALVNGRGVEILYDPEELGWAEPLLQDLEGYSLRQVRDWGVVETGGCDPESRGDGADGGEEAADSSGDDGNGRDDAGAAIYLTASAGVVEAATFTGNSPGARVAFVPRVVGAGIGCRRGTDEDTILLALEEALAEAGLHPASVGGLASVEAKEDEEGLLRAAERLGVPLGFAAPETLQEVVEESGLSQREFIREQVGVGAVAEPAALWAAGPTARLVLPKRAARGVTVALARGEGRTA